MIFELSITGHDDYTSFPLEHPTKTAQEFDADVKNLIVEHGQEFLDKESKEDGRLIGNLDWIYHIYPFLLELGYFKPTIHYLNFPESVIIENDRYYANDKWKEVVGEELFDKACKHNDKVRSSI